MCLRRLGALLGLLSGVGGGCRPRSAPAPVAAAEAPAAAATAPAAAAAPAPASPAPLPADYDAAALVQDGAEPVKVYLAEPRNNAWASAVEEAIGGQLSRDVKHVVPGAGGVSMGCRTLSCLILIDAPAEKLGLAVAVTQLVTLGPITVNLGPSPEGRGQLLFISDRRMADPATFTSWFRRTRRKTLSEIRSGERPNPLPIPASDLPPE